MYSLSSPRARLSRVSHIQGHAEGGTGPSICLTKARPRGQRLRCRTAVAREPSPWPPPPRGPSAAQRSSGGRATSWWQQPPRRRRHRRPPDSPGWAALRRRPCGRTGVTRHTPHPGSPGARSCAAGGCFDTCNAAYAGCPAARSSPIFAPTPSVSPPHHLTHSPSEPDHAGQPDFRRPNRRAKMDSCGR